MATLPQTRQSLLVELGRRSDHAWAEFLEVYEHTIRAYCRTLGLQESDAEDAAQDVLAAVHQRLPTWDHEASGSFRAWLFRVARNITIDHIAARARRSGASVALEDVQVPATLRLSHEAALDREYRRATFDWAATMVQQEVSVSAWRAFTLTAMHGQKPELVAETLGIPVGAVYTARSRVIARLRDRVASLEDPQAPARSSPATPEQERNDSP